MTPSLRNATRWWLIGLLTAVGVVSGLSSYLLARREAKEFLDYQLREIALNIGDENQRVLPPPDGEEHDPEDNFVVQIWNGEGALIRVSNPDILIPRRPDSGFTQSTAAGIAWRTFTLVDPTRIVQVSQQVAVRDEAAQDAALRAVLPVAAVIPLAWLIIGWVIDKTLGRLKVVTSAVAARDVNNREPISLEGVPEEVAPLLGAMNLLLKRLSVALERQGRFVSDAAHELRTPLTALHLQIDNLKRAVREPTIAPQLAELEGGAKRASRLVGQLLKMARYDAGDGVLVTTPIDIPALVATCIADLVPLADSHRVDVGIIQNDVVLARGDESDWRVLIENLLDNAIRYTPQGGTVDVSVRYLGDAAEIEISDTGPGIHEDLKPRVFDRFFRAAPAEVEGSGLGLSIAKAIALRQQIDLEIDNREPGPGLVARLRFKTLSTIEDIS